MRSRGMVRQSASAGSLWSRRGECFARASASRASNGTYSQSEPERIIPMRTDATIDRKQVICRKSSHLGYSKVTARTGDIIVYVESENVSRVGRVIGRVAYAPPLSGDAQPIRNYLVVASLSNDLTFVGERWVNPEDVSQVFAVRAGDHEITRILSLAQVRP